MSCADLFVLSVFEPMVANAPRRTASCAEISAGVDRIGPLRPEGAGRSLLEHRGSYHIPVQLHLPVLRAPALRAKNPDVPTESAAPESGNSSVSERLPLYDAAVTWQVTPYPGDAVHLRPSEGDPRSGV